MIMIYVLFCVIVGIAMAHPAEVPDTKDNEVLPYDFTFVSRVQWGARAAKEVTLLHTPVPYVTIHHSYLPAACYDSEDCEKAMRAMQNMHVDNNGWWDIGYSFAVGSNGVVYEGRGWNNMGAHAKYFNYVSIGICLIGDWTSSLPPTIQIKSAKALIEAGVKLGYIQPDYRLVGHRQVRATECPGEALYNNIKDWQHYSNFPTNVNDLLAVQQIPDSVKEEIRNQT